MEQTFSKDSKWKSLNVATVWWRACDELPNMFKWRALKYTDEWRGDFDWLNRLKYSRPSWSGVAAIMWPQREITCKANQRRMKINKSKKVFAPATSGTGEARKGRHGRGITWLSGHVIVVPGVFYEASGRAGYWLMELYESGTHTTHKRRPMGLFSSWINVYPAVD